jgi:hypothetical protein
MSQKFNFPERVIRLTRAMSRNLIGFNSLAR